MKRGVSLIVVSVAVVVMLILVSSASVIGLKSVSTANFEKYLDEIERVNNFVNEYYTKNKKLPIKNQIISKESLGSDFYNEITKNGDNNNNLFVIDMSLLNVPNITRGAGSIESKDIFLVTENTNTIYYMGGFKYKSKVYYSQN